MVIDIAKSLERDRDRLEARIQCIRTYSLATERSKLPNELRGEDLAAVLLEFTKSHLVLETNPEAISLSFPIIAFQVDQGTLNPDVFQTLMRPQGHESVISAKFQLAIKLAPTLTPDLLAAIIAVWTQTSLNHSLISAMKEFTIQVNVNGMKHLGFIPFFQEQLLRPQAKQQTGEVLTALIDIVQLPALSSAQGEVLAGLAEALSTSAEVLFGFGDLFRKCDKQVIYEFVTVKRGNLLEELINLAHNHEKLCSADYPPGVILGSVLDLVLEVAKSKGANSLSFTHLLNLQQLINNKPPEERIELFFEWLSKANYDPVSNSDLSAYCLGLLASPVPDTLDLGGGRMLAFFQQVFVLCNRDYLLEHAGVIVAVKQCDQEWTGLSTLLRMAIQSPSLLICSSATAFLIQMLFRSEDGQTRLFIDYLTFSFSTLKDNAGITNVQLGALRFLLAIVKNYEYLTQQSYSPGGPISVTTSYSGSVQTWSFPQNAKLGDVRRALGCPYHSSVLGIRNQWYYFVSDDTDLVVFGNPIQIEVAEVRYYGTINPKETIATEPYIQDLITAMGSSDLQTDVWPLLRKVIEACPRQVALFHVSEEALVGTWQQGSIQQLIVLTVLRTSLNSALCTHLSLNLLHRFGTEEKPLEGLKPLLQSAYCCSLVAVASLAQLTTTSYSQGQADIILLGLFRLYSHYISANTSDPGLPEEPFPWISLVKAWVQSQQCSNQSVFPNFLSKSDIIRAVFFTNTPKPIQAQFSANLSHLATLFPSDEVDRRLIVCLPMCLKNKEMDTEEYFTCLREAIGRGRSDLSSTAQKIKENLEKMEELTVSESTLKGYLTVLAQEISAGRLVDTKKLALRLTTHYLFPSSENKYPFCKSISAQEAGFALLYGICMTDSFALTEVMNSLARFHAIRTWRKGSLKSWVVSAQEEKTLAPFTGLRNQGATCYLNSTLQQFYMLQSFRNSITLISHLEPGVTQEVAKLLLKLQYSAKPFIQTKGLCGVYKNWDGEPINPREQMDVEEFLGGLLTKMEEELGPIGGAEIIQRTFKSTTVNTIRGLAPCTHESQREETHFTIPIEVKNKRSVRESLETLIEKEAMEGDSAYSCEDCHCKVTAEKSQRFQTLPEVLVLALRRFEYSVELGQRKKINDYFEFEEELDMSAYLQTAEMMSMRTIRRNTANLYRLTGIILHMGEAEAGHYIALAKDKDRWIQFNDTQISVIGDKERREMSVGQPDGPFAQTSAYLLIYQKQFEEVQPSMHTIRAHSGSEASLIDQKNTDYLCKKSVFCNQYRKFVCNLLTNSHPNENLARFAISDFLTIHSRCQTPDPSLITALYDRMEQLPEVQQWFGFNLTSEDALNEFIIDCPHLLIRKFLASLFHKAVESAPADARTMWLRRVVNRASRMELPLSDRYTGLFELIYSISRKDLQSVVDSGLPAMVIAQMLKQRVEPLKASDSPAEWGYHSRASGNPQRGMPENSDSKLNYAFQLAIIARCLPKLRAESVRDITSQAFMREAVLGAFNKLGGSKLASIYNSLSQKQPALLDQYLECLKAYFQTCDYDKYRVATVQIKRIIGLNGKADVVNKTMQMVFQALEMNKGFVLAAATLIGLIYKLITTKPAVLSWYKSSREAGSAIEAWDREFRRFQTGASTLSLTKSPQFYQPSIYQVLPNFPALLSTLTSKRLPNNEFEGDSDSETYEMRLEGNWELQLAMEVVRVEMEKDMGLMMLGKYVEAGKLKSNFIATDDDRLMPANTKIPTSS
jgi:ubiquitin C-terminal hydrolase